eukprot:5489245-Amphidinium_carterae.1
MAIIRSAPISQVSIFLFYVLGHSRHLGGTVPDFEDCSLDCCWTVTKTDRLNQKPNRLRQNANQWLPTIIEFFCGAVSDVELPRLLCPSASGQMLRAVACLPSTHPSRDLRRVEERSTHCSACTPPTYYTATTAYQGFQNLVTN